MGWVRINYIGLEERIRWVREYRVRRRQIKLNLLYGMRFSLYPIKTLLTLSLCTRILHTRNFVAISPKGSLKCSLCLGYFQDGLIEATLNKAFGFRFT